MKRSQCVGRYERNCIVCEKRVKWGEVMSKGCSGGHRIGWGRVRVLTRLTLDEFGINVNMDFHLDAYLKGIRYYDVGWYLVIFGYHCHFTKATIIISHRFPTSTWFLGIIGQHKHYNVFLHMQNKQHMMTKANTMIFVFLICKVIKDIINCLDIIYTLKVIIVKTWRQMCL